MVNRLGVGERGVIIDLSVLSNKLDCEMLDWWYSDDCGSKSGDAASVCPL
jgi:hypothetical protein